MRIQDLSDDELALFRKHDQENNTWFEVTTPYLDSRGAYIKINFIRDKSDERIGKWYIVSDNGLLYKLGLSDFLKENYSDSFPILDGNNNHTQKVNVEYLGKAVIRMAEYISGLSNLVKAKLEEKRKKENES